MNEVLQKMKELNDTQQLKFLLSNPKNFVGNPLIFILTVSDSLQDKISYLKYLQLLNNIAIQKRNIALLKATETAILEVEKLNI